VVLSKRGVKIPNSRGGFTKLLDLFQFVSRPEFGSSQEVEDIKTRGWVKIR
jgi:hypothetical protein